MDTDKAERSRRFGYYFFMGCAIAIILFSTIGTIQDMHAGVNINWKETITMLIPGLSSAITLTMFCKHGE